MADSTLSAVRSDGVTGPTSDAAHENSPRRLLRHALTYGSASYVAAALNALRGLMIARILGPESYGVWSLLTLVLVWTQFADLGLASAVNRQIPIAAATGDRATTRRLTSVSLGLKLGFTGLASAGILVAALLQSNPIYREGLAVVAALALLQAIQQYGASVLLAERRPAAAGRLLAAFAVVNLALTVGGAYLGGLRGVWYGFAAALGLTAVLYLTTLRVWPSLRVSRDELRQMVVIGLPLVALALISYNLVNIDQIVIAKMLGSTQLAFYTIGLTVGGLLYIAPSSIASILGPPLIEKWRRGEDDVRRFAWEPVRLLRDLYWIPVVAAMALLMPAVSLVLPAYREGVAPALVYLPGAYLLGINLGVSTYLLALGRHWANIPLSLLVVGVSAGFEVVFVKMGLGLVGVALGSTVGYLTYSVVHLVVVRVNMGDRVSQAALNTVAMLAPAVVLVSAMLAPTVLPAPYGWGALGLVSVVYAAVVAPRLKSYASMLRRTR